MSFRDDTRLEDGSFEQKPPNIVLTDRGPKPCPQQWGDYLPCVWPRCDCVTEIRRER